MSDNPDVSENDAKCRSAGTYLFIFGAVTGLITFVAVVAYSVFGMPGIVVAGLIITYGFLEAAGTLITSAMITAACFVLSRIALVLSRNGLYPTLPNVSESSVKLLRNATILAILFATVWFTIQLMIDR